MAESIGIVGCGAIGQALLREADAERLPVTIAGVTSRTESNAQAFLSTLRHPPPYLERGELIARSDLVVETAGGHVVAELARETFEAGTLVHANSAGFTLELAKGCFAVSNVGIVTAGRKFCPEPESSVLPGANLGHFPRIAPTARCCQQDRYS